MVNFLEVEDFFEQLYQFEDDIRGKRDEEFLKSMNISIEDILDFDLYRDIKTVIVLTYKKELNFCQYYIVNVLGLSNDDFSSIIKDKKTESYFMPCSCIEGKNFGVYIQREKIWLYFSKNYKQYSRHFNDFNEFLKYWSNNDFE